MELELVSENTDEQIREREILGRLRPVLIELAANMIRVVRGTGKSYEIMPQVMRVLQISEQYWDLTHMRPPYRQLLPTISKQERFDARLEKNPRDALSYLLAMKFTAEDRVIEAALQIAASRIINQRAQESTGQMELDRSMSALEQANKGLEAYWKKNPMDFDEAVRRVPAQKRPPKPARRSRPRPA